jgi:dTDP-L-rhamnose 4-epimerase
MRVLVTGGAGFIGSHIVRALAGRGDEVLVLDALLPAVHGPGRPVLPPGVRLVVGDVRDRSTVDDALSTVDAVCHQAAMVGLGADIQDLPAYAGCNDLGTAVLLAAMAASGHRALVLASSMVVYGEGRYTCAAHGPVSPGPRRPSDLDSGRYEPPCPHCGQALAPLAVPETAAPDPRNAYAASKVAQEHFAASWSRGVGGVVAALRYHNVYGPGMPRDTPYAGVAALFRSALERGEAHRASSRTAPSGATSCTYGTWPRRTWPRWTGPPRSRPARCARSTWAAAPRAPSGTWRPRSPRRTAVRSRW